MSTLFTLLVLSSPFVFRFTLRSLREQRTRT
jgi:hypothetical protein